MLVYENDEINPKNKISMFLMLNSFEFEPVRLHIAKIIMLNYVQLCAKIK